jgi:hypothetical protein
VDETSVEELPPQWRDRLLTAAAVLAAVAAYLLAAAAGDAHGWARAGLLGLGGLATAATIVIGAVARRRSQARQREAEQVALDAAEELTLTLNGALAPITSYLGELAAAPSWELRLAVAGQLRQAVVDAVVRLTAQDTRSTYYALDDGGSVLVRMAYAGRSTIPRFRFRAGTADGDAVLDLVRRGDFVFIDDVEASPMVTPSHPGDYRTVLAVAVTAGPRRLGMLTVDAVRRGDLTATDVELVRVLGNLLGAGLGQVADA